MRVAPLVIASCILVVGIVDGASAQLVEPFKVLEEARRDRLALEQRLALQAAARRQKEKEDKAAQANAEHQLGEDRRRAANTPIPSPPSAQPGISANPDVAPGVPGSAASPDNALRGIPRSEQPQGLMARGIEAGLPPPPNALIEPVNGDPRPHQTAEPPVHAITPRAAISAPPASGADNDLPASNQPMVRDGVAEPSRATPPPRVLITVDKAAQRMRITVDGQLRYSWSVSTGRAQYETPTGTFRPLRLAKVHYSREWDDAPMPHSIFFTDRGHAIHGSNATRFLGRRASHGCVRLAPAKAAMLFALVQAEGPGATQVMITGGMSAEGGARPRAVEARARKTTRVQRASSDLWQVDRRDDWVW